MKTILNLSFIMTICLMATFATGQKIAKSPAKEMLESFHGSDVTINYNAPSVRDRDIWGGLVPYDKVWRTGANGATKITLAKDMEVEGKKLAAGTYAIFTIPSENSWTVIFNTDSDQWGAYDYSDAKDALRVDVVPVKVEEKTEQMTFVKADESAIHLLWDNLAVPIRIGPAM